MLMVMIINNINDFNATYYAYIMMTNIYDQFLMIVFFVIGGYGDV